MAVQRGAFSKLKPEAKAKFLRVMHEWHTGKLKTPTGLKITDQKQALAVAFSEARRYG